MTPTLAARFWAKVDRSAGDAQCWTWTAARSSNGYGRIGLGGRNAWPRNVYAHRLSFYLAFGFWPPEHTDHLCRNKACVNPAHLEAVAPVVNIRRARPDICPNGHPLSGDNLRLVNDKHRTFQMRRCRTCHRAYMRTQYEAHNARRRARRRILRAQRQQPFQSPAPPPQQPLSASDVMSRVFERVPHVLIDPITLRGDVA